MKIKLKYCQHVLTSGHTLEDFQKMTLISLMHNDFEWFRRARSLYLWILNEERLVFILRYFGEDVPLEEPSVDKIHNGFALCLTKTLTVANAERHETLRVFDVAIFLDETL